VVPCRIWSASQECFKKTSRSEPFNPGISVADSPPGLENQDDLLVPEFSGAADRHVVTLVIIVVVNSGRHRGELGVCHVGQLCKLRGGC